ncbi:TonB-dependent receptor [Pedobacter sp. Du54]|uniref:TonB-dependent receptor n=1 Tax=Pedobacter anseongensis TaxID=3133439 RepID=UPI003094B542
MKSQLTLKKAFFTLLFIGFGAVVFAQGTGKISGIVTDKKTGEPLIGAGVKIAGTTKGIGTDVEGKYMLSGLADGKYTLEISYITYSTKKITEIEVKANSTTTLNVVLEESANLLNQVVITGTAKQESINSLYARQKNSVSISDGISADVIKKSPDRNTGEILKRVSGATVQDNKFVIVRGLSDRYNNATLNNAPLPSTEADRKTFSFDVIPSSMVDQITISKTASPDMPGDFAGGAIQIKTKDFPELKTFEINYGMGFNSISTFKDFYGNKRSGLDYLAFGANRYQLPTTIPSSANRYQNQNIDQKIESTKQFVNTWGVQKLGTALPNQNLQVVYGNSFRKENGSKYGLILAATYRNSALLSEQVRNDFNDIQIDEKRGEDFFGYTDTYYNYSTALSLLANVAYTKGTNKYALKNVINQNFEDNFLDRNGFSDERDYDKKIAQQEVIQKTLLSSVLEGEHLLNKDNQSKLNWNLSYSLFKDDQPDLRRIAYSRAYGTSDTFLADIPNIPTTTSGGRFFSNLQENIYGGTVNYVRPFKWLNESQVFKAGLLKQYKHRNVDSRSFGYRNNFTDVEESRLVRRLPIAEVLSDQYIARDMFYLEDVTNPFSRYTGTGDLNAGYVMMNAILARKIKASFGLRVENYIEMLTNDDTKANAASIENNYVDFLPSVNLTYELNTKTNLRLSYSSTVARAQFRELAPFSFYDFVTGVVKIGNPELKRTTINNADVRYEFYPSAGQLISVSGFYKRLNNAIENYYISGSTAASKTISFLNAPVANVYGAEIEIRKDLSLFNNESAFFKNLVFSFNASVIKSEIDFTGADPKYLSTINTKRTLQGQSPYIINTGLGYNAIENGWTATLLYNKIGRRISIVGLGQMVDGNFHASYPDIYENPRDLLDFQFSKKLIKNKGEIKLNIGNILNSEGILYQDVNKDKVYNKNTNQDQLINQIKYGTNVSLTFGYKF